MKFRLVVVTATGVYPISTGGPAVFLHYLSLGLRKLGISVEIFNFSSVRKLRKAFFSFLRAIKHVTTSNVIIFNSPPIGPHLLLLYLAKVLGKKTVFICHGGIFFECKGLLNKIHRQILIAHMRNNFIKYTVVPSKWLTSFLKKHKTKSEVLSIPNGVDVEEIISYLPSKLSTKNNILFIGRLAKIKGVSTLIDAFSLLTRKKRNCNLYMAGPIGDLDPSELDRIKNTPNVYFLGYISHERKMSLMRSVDVIVVPSVWENFPIVILEAMACAKPVVATSVGGIPEIIDSEFNGILIPPFNPKALSDAIKDLLDNRQKSAIISRNAYHTVKNRYDWKKITLVYKEFLSATTCNQHNS